VYAETTPKNGKSWYSIVEKIGKSASPAGWIRAGFSIGRSQEKEMTNITEDELQTASALVAFRAPANLVAALDKATADDMCSRSDVARRALLDYVRQRGLLPEPKRDMSWVVWGLSHEKPTDTEAKETASPGHQGQGQWRPFGGSTNEGLPHPPCGMGTGEQQVTDETDKGAPPADPISPPLRLAIELAASARGIDVNTWVREALALQVSREALLYAAEIDAEERAALAQRLAAQGIVLGPGSEAVHWG
jgi:hypothetical protein